MKKTIKQRQIAYIKKVIEDWGATNSGGLNLDHSPCVNSLGDGDVCELIEGFNVDGVSTTIYDRDAQEIDWWNYTYEELSDDIIDEITEIMLGYEADMMKTEKRIQS